MIRRGKWAEIFADNCWFRLESFFIPIVDLTMFCILLRTSGYWVARYGEPCEFFCGRVWRHMHSWWSGQGLGWRQAHHIVYLFVTTHEIMASDDVRRIACLEASPSLCSAQTPINDHFESSRCQLNMDVLVRNRPRLKSWSKSVLYSPELSPNCVR